MPDRYTPADADELVDVVYSALADETLPATVENVRTASGRVDELLDMLPGHPVYSDVRRKLTAIDAQIQAIINQVDAAIDSHDTPGAGPDNAQVPGVRARDYAAPDLEPAADREQPHAAEGRQ